MSSGAETVKRLNLEEMSVDDLVERSPREYLRGKDWDERRRVGLGALIRFGVLKP